MSTLSKMATRFRENGIDRVAIIDDAYDAPSVSEPDRLEFWTLVSDDKELLEALKKRDSSVVDEHSINDSLIAKLWDERGALDKLKDVCDKTVFRDALQKLVDLDHLRECLSELGISKIQELGAAAGALPAESTKLVFLDFSLEGYTSTVTEADLEDPEKLAEMLQTLDVPQKSKNKARNIWDRASIDKPFIVLMSSHREAEYLKTRFLDESHVLGGLFGFMSKGDFVDKDKVLLRLAAWGIGDVQCQQIQRFVNAAVDSVDDVVDKFKRVVRRLDVHDYSHIQRMALRHEGHPLGDYMVWLFDALLSYEFRADEGLQKEQNEVDKLTFDNCFPCAHSFVGTELARAYWRAQTIPSQCIGAHPWAREGEGDENSPLFALGDLFIKDLKSKAYVLINAPCSLRFVPDASSKRPFKPQLSLVMIPGRIGKLDVPSPEDAVSTNFVEYNSNIYKIVWDLDAAMTIANSESWTYLRDNGYERVSRLRPLYALEIKTHFLSRLGRLGTPVTPPLVRLCDVSIFLRTGEHYHVHGEKIKKGCMVFTGRDGENFLLTTVVVDRLLVAVREHWKNACVSLKEEITSLNPSGEFFAKKKEGKEQKLAEIESYTLDILDWLALARVPMKQPVKGNCVTIGPMLTSLRYEADEETLARSDTPIVLNVEEIDSPGDSDDKVLEKEMSDE